MSTTRPISTAGIIVLTALCAVPVTASQQDDASNRRKPPAPAAAATAAPVAAKAAPAPAVQATAPTTITSVVRKYQVTASEGRIIPGHIRVHRGDVVRITFVSTDDTYGIRFKDFGIKEKLTKEKPVTVELRPTQVGTFEFRCTRTWGVSHFNKNGALVVE